MIKNIFVALLISIFVFFNGTAEAGQKIVAVQSKRFKPYDQALKGFKTICDMKIKRLIVADLKGGDVVKEIHKIAPDMVLAIGNEALSIVKEINNIPIVYLMVLNPELIIAGENNITGVSINLSPGKQFLTLITALPDIEKIGIIYDPDKTGLFVNRIQKNAERHGKKLITREVSEARDMPSALMSMKGEIDAFWMLPDLTVITPETVKFLFLFCLENTIPVIAFSEKYVESGALLSIGIDSFDIGIQAGEMAKNILLETKQVFQQADARKAVVSVNSQIARKTVVSINQLIAQNLGVTIDKETFRQARKIN
jgi:putative ABC transport system substrate-binding protein